MHPRDAFSLYTEGLLSARAYWLDVLQGVSDAQLGILVDDVPQERITEVSAQFAKRLLAINKRALLDLRGNR